MTPEQLEELKGHTPGPWVYVETLSSCYVKAGHFTEHSREIVYYPYSLTPTTDSANAKLIAAAPDLLDHIDEQQRKIEQLTAECDRLLAESKREHKITNKYIQHLHNMQSQRDQLKVLMQDAYYEGYRDGELGERGPTQSWKISDTRAELEEAGDDK